MEHIAFSRLGPSDEELNRLIQENGLQDYMNNLTPNNTPTGPSPIVSRRASTVLPPDCPLGERCIEDLSEYLMEMQYNAHVLETLPGLCLARMRMDVFDGNALGYAGESPQENNRQDSGPHSAACHNTQNNPISSHNSNDDNAPSNTEPCCKDLIQGEVTCKNPACQYNSDGSRATRIAPNNPYYSEFQCRNPYHKPQITSHTTQQSIEFATTNPFRTEVDADHTQPTRTTGERASVKEIPVIRVKVDTNNDQEQIHHSTGQRQVARLVNLHGLSKVEAETYFNTKIGEKGTIAEKDAFAPLEKLINL